MWEFFTGVGVLTITLTLAVAYLQEEVELQERLEHANSLAFSLSRKKSASRSL